MRVLLGLVAVTLSLSQAEARSIGEKAVENHIRPAYTRLASAMEALQQATAVWCGGPGSDRAGLDEAFRQAVLAWAGVEHLRFGPIAQDSRHERFAFWPDPKGLGQKQLSAVLRERSLDATSPETLRQKSVALQGLTAFEALFWGDGKAFAATDGRSFACALGGAIAGNLAQMATAVRNEWAADAGFAANLIAPGPDKLYREDKEVILELFKAFRAGLQQVRSLKIQRVFMGNPEEAQPRRAAFWRSGNAVDVIAANIDALQQLYREAGLYEIVRQAGTGAERSTLDQFSLVKGTLAPFAGKDIAAIAADKDGWGKFNSVFFGLMNIQITGGNAIVEAAQLPMTFNALDGD
jgi:uncharacterized protein